MQAFLFSLAVAVGLTPEMLPMIVTVNLSKGAIAMSRKKVIVKRLNSIQNFGAMDVLCTDKTGTITEGKIVLEKLLDVSGHESDRILEFAYLNSYFQTGLKNLMDVAVLNHPDLKESSNAVDATIRRLMRSPSISRANACRWSSRITQGAHILICKGAVEEIMPICTHVEVKGES